MEPILETILYPPVGKRWIRNFYSLSIRKKTAYAFYLLMTITAGSLMFAYGVVIQVESKVRLMELIDVFSNNTLELRRFEKNYFLYRQAKDLEENGVYWKKLMETFSENESELHLLASHSVLEEVRGALMDYRRSLQDLSASYRDEPDAKERHRSLEEAIRNSGKILTDFAERTSATERKSIRKLLVTIQNVIMTTIFIFFAVSFFLLNFLGEKVVMSLKLLEDYTRKISKGEAIEPPARPLEEEIRELITSFNRMRNELQMRQKQLIQSGKLASLGTLLAGVAHELNNPLSNISTSAQILEEELQNPDLDFKKELVGQIIEQSLKARDIVRALLEFARIKEFHKEPLPLKGLLEETMKLVRGHVKSRVSITLDIQPDVTIYADKQRMQQVFLNLIQNAMDALGENGNIWISARWVGEKEKKDEVEIIVEDNGPGIPPEIVERIFDPFFTTKDVGKGTGLGLAIVHDIIEAHGGSITLDSRPGVGTSFVIWLPGSQEKEKEQEEDE